MFTRRSLLLCCLGALAALSACEADSAGEDSFALTLDVALAQSNGDVRFVTPLGTVATRPASDIVGKPYFAAAFPAGFSADEGDPFEAEWGTVPEALSVSFSTSPSYPNGPYDLVFVVYVNTEIEPGMMQPGSVPPMVIQGDLATFTIDQSAALPGDPGITPGVVRVNVAGADERLEVSNRIPSDEADASQVAAALTNTIMLVP